MKRFSAHYIHIPSKGYLKQHVVEVDQGVVTQVFPLIEEVEDVEWYPGVIKLIQEGNSWIPYLFYPFDFKAMQPVSGTQRRRLL